MWSKQKGVGRGWLGLGGTAAVVRGHRPRVGTRPSAPPSHLEIQSRRLGTHSHLRGETEGGRLAALHPEVSTPKPMPSLVSNTGG